MSNNSYGNNKKSNKFIQDNIDTNSDIDNIFRSMNTRNLIGQNLKKNVDYTKSNNSNNNVNPKKNSFLSNKKNNDLSKSNNNYLNNKNISNNTNKSNNKKKRSFFDVNENNVVPKQNNSLSNNANVSVKKSNFVSNQNFSDNEQENKNNTQQLDITIIFIWILFGFSFIIMLVNVVNYYKDSSNGGNNSNNGALTDEHQEFLQKQEENKKELSNMCRLVDSYGNYNYEEYVSHIGKSDIDNLTDEEMFKVLSEVNYCYQDLCILVEETGIINYMDCVDESYSRVTYDEYQDLFNQQTKYEELLDKACKNIEADGSYDSGAASGTRVTCDNYVCSIDNNGKNITKTCK